MTLGPVASQRASTLSAKASHVVAGRCDRDGARGHLSVPSATPGPDQDVPVVELAAMSRVTKILPRHRGSDCSDVTSAEDGDNAGHHHQRDPHQPDEAARHTATHRSRRDGLVEGRERPPRLDPVHDLAEGAITTSFHAAGEFPSPCTSVSARFSRTAWSAAQSRAGLDASDPSMPTTMVPDTWLMRFSCLAPITRAVWVPDCWSWSRGGRPERTAGPGPRAHPGSSDGPGLWVLDVGRGQRAKSWTRRY